MARFQLVLRKLEDEYGGADFYEDRQGRVRHRHARSWSDPYGKTLYARANSRWVKYAQWCPECHVGILLEEGQL